MDDYFDGMNEGELELYRNLKSYESETFKVMPNVLLKRHNEGTNQMDLIAITKKGVFVFEMKDYSGWIFGNEDNKEWTQVLNSGKHRSKKIKFKNPVKQNDNHIKTIKHLMNSNSYYYPVFNIVVFGKNATLKEVTTSIDVVTLNDVYSVIEKYPDVVITNETIDSIYALIKENALIGNDAMADHVAYAKSFSQLVNEENVERETISKSIVKKSNSKKTIAIFAILVLLVWITMMQPLMSLFIIAMIVPRGRRKRPRYSVYTYLIFVLIIFAFTFYMDAIESRAASSNTQLVSNVDNTQKRYDVQDSTELNAIENVTFVENSSEVEIGETSLATIEITTEPYVEIMSDLSESTQSDTNQSEKTHSAASQSGFVPIILGSNIEDVVSIFGEPDKIVNTRWHYKNSYFDVDVSGLVTGWRNTYEQLNSAMYRPEGGKIDLGSTKEDVIKALGSPTEINVMYPNKWQYSNSFVLFNENREVEGWRNTYEQLNSAMYRPEGGKIDLGSTKEDVIKALGSPTEIDVMYPNKWQYSNSFVLFNENREVIGWRNTYDQLNSAMYRPESGKIDLGSTKQDVIKALGSPTEIESRYPNKWQYSNSFVSFNENWEVIGWRNTYDQLKSAMYQPESGKIDLGSTKHDVIRALGSPTEIDSRYPNKWQYSNSFILFNESWEVIGWRNTYDQLNSAMRLPSGGKISVGSSIEAVVTALGSPTEINPSNSLKWLYYNSYIQFNNDWQVTNWLNNYDQLTKALN